MDRKHTFDDRCESPTSPCERTFDQNEKDEILAKRLQQEEIEEVERQKMKEKEEFQRLQVLTNMCNLHTCVAYCKTSWLNLFSISME